MANLILKYDGTEAGEGIMDVYTLAPALLSFGDMAKEVNRIVNGPEHEIKINIQSDFKHGSFDIGIELASLIEQVKTLLDSQTLYRGAQGVAAIITIYWTVKKFLKGKKPKEIIKVDQTTNITIINKDNERCEAPSQIESIINNRKINESLEGVVSKPLKRSGIESVSLTEGKTKKTEIVTSNEAPYFETIESENQELLTSSTQTIGITIHTLSFETNTWRFNVAGAVKWLEIKDKDFIARVSTRRESFRKGDILLVDIQTEQCLVNNEIQTTETIIKVNKHISGPEQKNLDFDQPSIPPDEEKKET